MTACVTFWSGATGCLREASGRSAWKRCSAILVCRDCDTYGETAPCREYVMKPVGKPDAGNPHVRFDERGGETGCFGDTAPLLDSTVYLRFQYFFHHVRIANRDMTTAE